MHNLSANGARSTGINKEDAQIYCIIKELWCLGYLYPNTPICCGLSTMLINAYFLGKEPLTVEKCVEFG